MQWVHRSGMTSEIFPAESSSRRNSSTETNTLSTDDRKIISIIRVWNSLASRTYCGWCKLLVCWSLSNKSGDQITVIPSHCLIAITEVVPTEPQGLPCRERPDRQGIEVPHCSIRIAPRKGSWTNAVLCHKAAISRTPLPCNILEGLGLLAPANPTSLTIILFALFLACLAHGVRMKLSLKPRF